MNDRTQITETLQGHVVETLSVLTRVAGILMFALASPVQAGNMMASDTAPDIRTIYQNRCAACHLPTGKGVKGIYPPLLGQVGKYYETEAGIEYLTYVITHGLNLPIDVMGVKYRGIMPSVVSDFTDETIAYLVSDLELSLLSQSEYMALAADRDDASTLVISAEKVKAIRATQKTPMALKALRRKALEGAK